MYTQDLGVSYLDLFLIHWPHAFASGQGMFPKNAEGNVLYDNETNFTETWKGEYVLCLGFGCIVGYSSFFLGGVVCTLIKRGFVIR